jgi:hypothetical protein
MADVVTRQAGPDARHFSCRTCDKTPWALVFRAGKLFGAACIMHLADIKREARV